MWDERALVVWIDAIEEALIPGLAEQVEETARSIAPVRARHTSIPSYAHHGYVGVPGHLKASVGSNVDRDKFGLYADIYSLWYGRFLDPKARQLHRLYPFLPSSLYFVVQGRTYYL